MNDAERFELPHIFDAAESPLMDELSPLGYYDRSGNVISFRDWARLKAWDETRQREYTRVAQTTVGDYWISTVWIGLNHNFGDGPPLIFETMVFNKSFPDQPPLSELFNSDVERPEFTNWTDLDMRRYSTEEEALLGHEEMVEKVRLIVEATS